MVLACDHWDEASVPSEEQSLVEGQDRVLGMEVSHPGEFLRHHLYSPPPEKGTPPSAYRIAV